MMNQFCTVSKLPGHEMCVPVSTEHYCYFMLTTIYTAVDIVNGDNL